MTPAQISDSISEKEWQIRVDLAAALRWTARLNLHEAVANHYSVVISDDGKEFLLNPKLRHFSRVKASDMVKLHIDDKEALNRPDAPDITAWYLHSQLHASLPHAKVIFHTHMPNTLALACLKDFEFLMLDQNATRFYDRIAYDREYNGLAIDDQEGARCAELLKDGKSILFMGNHGVMIVGETVADVFDEMYYLEKAAETQVKALATGHELAIIPDDVAEIACEQWHEYPGFSNYHFNELKAILDDEEPVYKS